VVPLFPWCPSRAGGLLAFGSKDDSAAQVRAGEAHIVWRRIGTHKIFTRP
jgi:hypothetical protein